MSLFPGWMILVILKCIYFRCIPISLTTASSYQLFPGTAYIASYIEYYISYIQYYMYISLLEYPYLLLIWNSIPVFNHANPFSFLTNNWKTLVVLVILSLLGKYTLNREMGEEIMPSYINVYGSSIGVMNTGIMDIRKIESIAAHLDRLPSMVNDQIAYAIMELTRAVTEAKNLDNSKRSEVLDQLNGLAQQAALPVANRSIGISRALVNALGQALEAVGNLADVWSTWGETIKRFFGI